MGILPAHITWQAALRTMETRVSELRKELDSINTLLAHQSVDYENGGHPLWARRMDVVNELAKSEQEVEFLKGRLRK